MELDILLTSHDIEAAGLERKPAEVIARTIHQQGKQLATRADIERLEKSTGERLNRLEKSTGSHSGQVGRQVGACFDRYRKYFHERCDRLDKGFPRLGATLDRLQSNIIVFGTGDLIAQIVFLVTLLIKL